MFGLDLLLSLIDCFRFHYRIESFPLALLPVLVLINLGILAADLKRLLRVLCAPLPLCTRVKLQVVCVGTYDLDCAGSTRDAARPSSAGRVAAGAQTFDPP